jgi:hypothetical protein
MVRSWKIKSVPVTSSSQAWIISRGLGKTDPPKKLQIIKAKIIWLAHRIEKTPPLKTRLG